MARQLIIAKLGIGNARGTIQLNPVGTDCLKAIVARWINQAQNGLDNALASMGKGADAVAQGRADYYRNAISFLTQRFVSQCGFRQDCRDTMPTVAQWMETMEHPLEWTPFIIQSEDMGDSNGLTNVAHAERGDAGELVAREPVTEGRRNEGATDNKGGRQNLTGVGGTKPPARRKRKK